MIMFGKVEILATTSAEKASFYKDVLSRENIDYESKTKNASVTTNIMRTSGNLGRVGEEVMVSLTYHIYVKKSDVDKANHAIYEAEKNK